METFGLLSSAIRFADFGAGAAEVFVAENVAIRLEPGVLVVGVW